MVKSSNTVVVFILALSKSSARTWLEDELLRKRNLIDPAGIAFLEAKERELLNESARSPALTTSPAPTVDHSPTTDAPSPSPSRSPTVTPSFVQIHPPPLQPPTLPKERHSPVPSMNPSSPSHEMQDAKGYFNYDDSSGYGPGDWGNIELPDNFYWNEFDANGFGPWKGLLTDRKPGENKCVTGKRQSPIDVRENAALCDEMHEIRDRPGDYSLTSAQVDKRIESNKLRLVYPRRLCLDVWDPLCQVKNPPYADFPNGWKGTGDVVHIDFKIPGEHMIWGQDFDAEMQIFHIHPMNKRLATVATLIRAEVGGFNSYFQEAINAFKRVYDNNRADCEYFLETGHVFGSDNAESKEYSGANFTTPVKKPEVRQTQGALSSNKRLGLRATGSASSIVVTNTSQTRDLQVMGVWNPFHPMLIPTIHFYRYDGSLTEPPCAEMVSWFISDQPMVISPEQLDQMKTIQFTNVDNRCQLTSIPPDHGTARSIQTTYRRKVWRCTEHNFGPDPQ